MDISVPTSIALPPRGDPHHEQRSNRAPNGVTLPSSSSRRILLPSIRLEPLILPKVVAQADADEDLRKVLAVTKARPGWMGFVSTSTYATKMSTSISTFSRAGRLAFSSGCNDVSHHSKPKSPCLQQRRLACRPRTVIFRRAHHQEEAGIDVAPSDVCRDSSDATGLRHAPTLLARKQDKRSVNARLSYGPLR